MEQGFTPHRKTLAEMKAERGWSKAEETFLRDARTGTVWFSDARPEEETDENRVRADLIVHVVMGGCEDCPVPSKGVGVEGGWIAGEIDLEGCRSDQPLKLLNCHLDTAPMLLDAHLGGLYLPGCKVPGLNANRLNSQTSVHFALGFEATRTVSLVGAKITGQLACVGGSFDGNGGTALNCNAAEIGASVLLNDGFRAEGLVSLLRARITGQLDCARGSIANKSGKAISCDSAEIGADVFLRDGFNAEGLVEFVRVQIRGNLRMHRGTFGSGFDGEGMHIGGGWYFCDLEKFKGPLDLTDAEVGRLEDDAAAWEVAKPLHFTGFRYQRLTGDLRVADRLRLLERKEERFIPPAFGEEVEVQGRLLKLPTPWINSHYKPQFNPQPYSQLAKILLEQGDERGAARVLHRRDQRIAEAAYHRAQAGLDGTWSAGWNSLLASIRRPVNWIFDLVFGMGHKPARALVALLFIWAFAVWLYGTTYDQYQFAPTSDVVLTSDNWVNAVEAHAADDTNPMPLAAWLDTPSAQDYETFNRYIYAFDVFIPLDSLGQEAAWAPSPVRGDLGWWGFHLKPFIQIAGWIITAVGAAAVTGLVGKRD